MLATVVLLAACGNDDPEDATPETEETAADVESDEDDGDESTTGTEDDAPPVEDTSAEDDQSAEDADGGQDDSPFEVRTGSIDLDEVASFDSGVQVAVTGLTVEPMAILVDVEVLNGWTDDYTLSGWNEPRLTDNNDRQYPYVEPEENQDLRVPAGGTLQATLAFRGALNPNATRVEVLLNRGSSRDQHREAQFRDLPLPEGD